MYILGINSAYHESSVCLLKDGEIVSAIEEERLNRVKHGKCAEIDNPDELPYKAIELVLRDANLGLNDIDYIGYSLSPEVRLKTAGTFIDDIVEPDSWGCPKGEEVFSKQIKRTPAILKKMGFSGSFHWLPHHHCHAASSYYLSSFSSSAILVLDGIGELSSGGIFLAEGNKIKKVAEFPYPASIGFLWEKLSVFLGFTEYDACKVMGLAAYGDASVYKSLLDDLVQTSNDGMFSINNSILQFRSQSFSELEEVFGISKRSPAEKLNREHENIAAALQLKTEEVICHIANHISNTYKEKNLCMSGGVALNCVANNRLLNESLFQNIYIPAAAHDAGTAIGSAYWIWHMILGEEPRSKGEQVYLGPEFSAAGIKEALNKSKLSWEYEEDIARKTAELISNGNIISWFQGRMEFGSRGLGNRGIFADPRRKEVKQLINEKIKHREAFRPFAPSILKEKLHDWYEVKHESALSNYMLLALPVKKGKEIEIPGVIHHDGSSRVQTVEKHNCPLFYNLINRFYDLTQVPMILNTSFNDQEPIVCTPEDAVKTFLNTQLDYLVIGHYIASRP